MRISGKLRRAFRTLADSLGRRRAPPTSETDGTFPWEKSYPADIDWRVDITPRPLPDLLDEAAAAYGDQTCISFRGRRFLYRDVADQVNRAAKGFQALGVHKGIKVGLMLPMPTHVGEIDNRPQAVQNMLVESGRRHLRRDGYGEWRRSLGVVMVRLVFRRRSRWI